MPAKWGAFRWGEMRWGEEDPSEVTTIGIESTAEVGIVFVTGGSVSPTAEGFSWDQLPLLPEGIPPGQFDTVTSAKNRLWKQFEE